MSTLRITLRNNKQLKSQRMIKSKSEMEKDKWFKSFAMQKERVFHVNEVFLHEKRLPHPSNYTLAM